MSALAGVWRWGSRSNAEEDCVRMLAAQKIYGPHDQRQWSDQSIALGRCLFRALPEDIHDRQPLIGRDGRLVLVADLRLDNRGELAADLGLALGQAGQLCDAAILLECLERWGEKAVERLVGEFAIAVWIPGEKKLLLARDFLGQRPLHYHRGREFFAFASMPKGLHALPGIPYQVNEDLVAETLAWMPHDHDWSFFRHVSCVEPANIVTVTPASVTIRRYWNPQRAALHKPGDAVEGARHHLDQAVRARLRGAEQGLGAQLSGGLDSGAVTATAARLLTPGNKLFAFTAVPRQGYEGPDRRNRMGDEGPLAAVTAAMYPNIEHVLVRAGSYSPIALLERHFLLWERPAGTVANMGWWHAVHNEARDRNLAVMLTGQFGNLTLSYQGLELLPELLRAGRFHELWRAASGLVAKTDMRWRGALMRSFGPFIPLPIWRWINQNNSGRTTEIGNFAALRTEHIVRLQAMAKNRKLDMTRRPWADGFAMRLSVMRSGNVANTNKAALAGWGIDRRDPTADKRLVEFCLGLPTREYLRDGVTRALARRALAGRLPDIVLHQKKRGYQAADWHENLTASRAELAKQLERLEACAPAQRLLDIGRLKRLVEDWPQSGWEKDRIIQSYRMALMGGLAAGHFLLQASAREVYK